MWSIIKHRNLLSPIKMGQEILTFGDIEIKTNKFSVIKVMFF